MLKVGKLVMNRSIALAPKDTGNLRESGFLVFGGEKVPPQNISSSNFNTEANEGKRVAAEHAGVIGTFMASKRPNPFVVIGHSAFYALKEHEATEEDPHKFGQSKYLEEAVNRSHKEILNILNLKEVLDITYLMT